MRQLNFVHLGILVTLIADCGSSSDNGTKQNNSGQSCKLPTDCPNGGSCVNGTCSGGSGGGTFGAGGGFPFGGTPSGTGGAPFGGLPNGGVTGTGGLIGAS